MSSAAMIHLPARLARKDPGCGQNMMLRAQETATTTLAQMAAGYTSAASVSAGISDSSSASLSYNFSGELDVR